MKADGRQADKDAAAFKNNSYRLHPDGIFQGITYENGARG